MEFDLNQIFRQAIHPSAHLFALTTLTRPLALFTRSIHLLVRLIHALLASLVRSAALTEEFLFFPFSV